MFDKNYLTRCLGIVGMYGMNVLVLDDYDDDELEALYRALKALFAECEGK